MNQQTPFGQDYKPQFSGHETFPLRYGWLEKAFDAVDASGLNNKGIFSEDTAIAHFGVGKNMVAAIRFWAQVAGVIVTEGKDLDTTRFGQELLRPDGLDPYLENSSSLWRIHWEIASNPKHTSAYWLFNVFNEPNFDRHLVSRRLSELIDQQGWKAPTPKTLANDINVLISNYVPSAQKRGPSEEVLNSPLIELGLIRRRSNGKYSLNWGRKLSLPSGVFLYAVCDFWRRSSSANTLNIQSLLLEPGSPGRVFLLEEGELIERLASVSDVTGGLISWSETAGLKQLIRSKPFPAEAVDSLWSSDFHHVGGAHAA
ncbi:DUF4007 family protein [Falsiruegeria mediterranea]|uniref:DUF4007 family protein n=1 Tax=Falsiruegeria mediterranea TaxID=1280832 RepID=UPI0015F25C5C|nr:DUF4007 family protein [Falsiruegeria mediterranea]